MPRGHLWGPDQWGRVQAAASELREEMYVSESLGGLQAHLALKREDLSPSCPLPTGTRVRIHSIPPTHMLPGCPWARITTLAFVGLLPFLPGKLGFCKTLSRLPYSTLGKVIEIPVATGNLCP